MVRKTYLKMVCCLQTDCFVCKAEGSRCLLWPRRRMFPRGYVFSHKDGQSQHLFQHILPHSVSQQRRIEAHLNVTKWVDIVHYVLWINLISVILSLASLVQRWMFLVWFQLISGLQWNKLMFLSVQMLLKEATESEQHSGILNTWPQTTGIHVVIICISINGVC